MTQRETVLNVLRAAGDTGVTNRRLNDVCFRYSARLQELRDQGFQIETVRLKQGLYLYRLQSEPTVPSRRDPSGPLLGETTVRDGVCSVSRPEGTGGTQSAMLEGRECGDQGANGGDAAGRRSPSRAGKAATENHAGLNDKRSCAPSRPSSTDTLFPSEAESSTRSAITGKPLEGREAA